MKKEYVVVKINNENGHNQYIPVTEPLLSLEDAQSRMRKLEDKYPENHYTIDLAIPES